MVMGAVLAALLGVLARASAHGEDADLSCETFCRKYTPSPKAVCRASRSKLPKPAVGQTCNNAFTSAFALACPLLCRDEPIDTVWLSENSCQLMRGRGTNALVEACSVGVDHGYKAAAKLVEKGREEILQMQRRGSASTIPVGNAATEVVTQAEAYNANIAEAARESIIQKAAIEGQMVAGMPGADAPAASRVAKADMAAEKAEEATAAALKEEVAATAETKEAAVAVLETPARPTAEQDEDEAEPKEAAVAASEEKVTAQTKRATAAVAVPKAAAVAEAESRTATSAAAAAEQPEGSTDEEVELNEAVVEISGQVDPDIAAAANEDAASANAARAAEQKERQTPPNAGVDFAAEEQTEPSYTALSAGTDPDEEPAAEYRQEERPEVPEEILAHE